jgi:DNA mismatch repair protein MutS2
VELLQCRHPILLSQFIEAKQQEDEDKDEKEIQGHWEFKRTGVVPVDLTVDQGTTTLIITGANAGGKTVALKTLGLFTLMAQAGMHIPVQEGSTLAVYDSIFADIGDEQKIEDSLSTFSAHIVQIDQILKRATPSSLILLDELGSGTDPSEGSALALGILDYLRERGSSTVVTTHLNLLKTYAYQHNDVKNVSVEFDPISLKPKYNLMYGTPGISNALAIARNLGMDEKILARANHYLTDSDKQIVELIQGLERTQEDILKEKETIKEAKNRAQAYETKAKEFLDTIKNRKEKILKEFEQEARKLLRESEEELMQIMKNKKRRIRLVRPDEGKNEFLNVKKKLYDRFPKTAYDKEAVEHLKVGQVIRVSHLQKNGIVASVDEEAKKAEVVIGTMRIKTTFQDLELPKGQEQKQQISKAPRPFIFQQPLAESLQKVNVIGMRVDEALPIVDKTIDQAIVQGINKIEIIHGKGTGRLMKAIREHLKDHRWVASFKSGDIAKGGTGITIVEIKE